MLGGRRDLSDVRHDTTYCVPESTSKVMITCQEMKVRHQKL
jgi:hypothetical protein